ncbi:ABC transporter substrate-binding protein [Nocardiopsis salina]|uniref:ABC transporter substrate-binding protein n=1 Tax=Nocardiopsis salina TaxID=245836 RepID=UPI000348416F|nr:extracellular solute-binding protein [Nocardiopsis salina]
MHHSDRDPPALRRRTLLRALAGAGALGALPALGGCGTDLRNDPRRVTMAFNRVEDMELAGMDDLLDVFHAATDYTVEVDNFEPNSYQESINNYLQGTPDDVVAWFGGYRLRFFAERGLISDLSHLWDGPLADSFSQAHKELCTGGDGKQYLVPYYSYPWAFYYRPSLFAENGYEPPATRAELLDLCERMRGDGLEPIGYGNREGWPAMGTFDHLNLRINGPEFHTDLANGDAAWDGPEVREVFSAWAELLPHHQPDPLGRSFDEAQAALMRKECGMLLAGLFVAQALPEDEADDLDFFVFPEYDPAVGTGAVEAPTDGFMLSANPRNPEGAEALLTHIGGLEAQELYADSDPQALPAHVDTDTARFNDLERKALELIDGAESVTQFLDRDTRPDFAAVVAIPAFQRFLRQPDDIREITSDLERQKRSVFG